MPALPIDFVIANPEPGYCPATFGEVVTKLRTLLSGTVSGASTPYIVQPNTPSVGEQGYIWFKTLDQKPIGIYKFYDGLWRKVYTGALNDVKLFSGDPAAVFDATGKGIPGGEQDGWFLMNGQNGTPDLSDKFVVAAHMNNAAAINGYSGGWRTTVNGAAAVSGGAGTVTLDGTTSFFNALPEIKVWKWMADGNTGGNAGSSSNNLYGTSSTPGTSTLLQTAVAGNTDPDAFSIIPPYYALAYCQFRGY